MILRGKAKRAFAEAGAFLGSARLVMSGRKIFVGNASGCVSEAPNIPRSVALPGLRLRQCCFTVADALLCSETARYGVPGALDAASRDAAAVAAAVERRDGAAPVSDVGAGALPGVADGFAADGPVG